MAEKLGILLVRKQLVTQEQVEEAAKLQVIYGGRLGTNLIELGYLDLDSLAGVLAEQRRLQAVTLVELDAATQATLDLLPAALAEKHMAFPLRVDRRSLHVAMASPFDFETVDALGFATGYRIVPKICPELRLLYYLEKRYGLERKARYIRLADDRPAARPPAASPSSGAIDRRKYLTATPELAQPGPPAREFDSALKPLGAGEYLTSEEDDLYSQAGGSLSPNLPSPAPVAPPPAAAPLSPSAARRAALGINPGQVPAARTLTPPGIPAVPPALAPSAPPTLAQAAPPTLAQAAPPTLAQAAPPTLAQAAPPTLAQAAPPTLAQAAPPTLGQAAPPTLGQAAPPTLASPEPPTLAPQPLSPSAARRAALGLGAPPPVAAPALVPPAAFAPPPAIAPIAPPAVVPAPAPGAPPMNLLAQDAPSPFAQPLEPFASVPAVAPPPLSAEPEELETLELDADSAVELEPLSAEELAEEARTDAAVAIDLEPEPAAVEELSFTMEEAPAQSAATQPEATQPAVPQPPVPPAVEPEPLSSGPTLLPLAAADAGDLATMNWDLAFDAPPAFEPPPAASTPAFEPPPAASTPAASTPAASTPAASTPALEAPTPEAGADTAASAVEAAPTPAEPATAAARPEAPEVTAAAPAESAAPAAEQLAPPPEPAAPEPAVEEPASEAAAPPAATAVAQEETRVAEPSAATEDSPAPEQPKPTEPAAAPEPDGFDEAAFAAANAAYLAAFDAVRAPAAEEPAAEASLAPVAEAPSLEVLAIPEPQADADAPRESEPELRSPPGMLLVEELLARAGDREKLAEGLIWFAEGRFSLNLILVVRGNIAAGWHGFGPGIDGAFVDKLFVPLDQPSILTAAIEAREAVVRERAESSLDRRLLAYLGLHPRSSLVAFPIFARDRLVNVVLGTRGSWPLRENIADESNRVSAAVGRCYERLLLLRKRIDD